jgi:putative two-component system response regulator
MLKPDRLRPEEWEIMTGRTLADERILQGGTSPYLQMGREIAAAHHELWDGSGYPLAARITTIADQYDALRTQRPYKPAIGHDETMAIFEDGDGRTEPGHFDPKVLRAFRECAERLRAIGEGLSGGALLRGWEETWGNAFS